MASVLRSNREYKKWVVVLKKKIQSAQIKAVVAVNKELLELYWEMGREICEKQRASNWGDGLIDRLAEDLAVEFPGVKGFSRTNLFNIKQWYVFYNARQIQGVAKKGKIVQQVVGQMGKKGRKKERGKRAVALVGGKQRVEERGIVQQVVGQMGDEQRGEEGEIVQQLVGQIPWGHNVLIVNKCGSVKEALFYVRETIRNGWSRAMLAEQIDKKLYRRRGKAIDNFSMTLPVVQSELAKETLKSPYNFDFLMLGKEAQERDVETALTNHIQKFILELGQGFAYMGRQYPLKVGEKVFYLDLLFYHTRLRCYVIVELKADEFKPEYAGKLNFYLNVVNAQLRNKEDRQSIGILLCKSRDKMIVEYSLENISGPLGVSEYQIMKAVPENLKGELPSIEDLEGELGSVGGG